MDVVTLRVGNLEEFLDRAFSILTFCHTYAILIVEGDRVVLPLKYSGRKLDDVLEEFSGREDVGVVEVEAEGKSYVFVVYKGHAEILRVLAR